MLEELALEVARAAVPELDEADDVLVTDVTSGVLDVTGTAAVEVKMTVVGWAVVAPLDGDSVTTEVTKAIEEP